MDYSGTDLSMVRGDSETINFILKNIAGERILDDTDIIEFAVRKKASSAERLIYKKVVPVNGRAVIDILPEDTSGLKFKDYVYDIQHTNAAGKVTTLVKCSTFSITEEVAY